MASQRYEDLHGIKNWDGLLDPLDLDLRTLILAYGDLSSAAERAFNGDSSSKYRGYSYYGKSSFFKGVMVPWADKKYQVTSFIYASAGFEGMLESNWMGYVAVLNDEFTKSTGHREICVVWRGTERPHEWLNNILGAFPTPAKPILPNVTGATTDTPQVMGGWLTIYKTSNPNSEFLKSSAREQIFAQIKKLLIKYKDEKISITCTGHSLGACLAVLSAVDLAANVVTPDINVSAFIFGSPQVGNNAFKKNVDKIPNLKILSVKNDLDIVPLWPSKILKWVDEKWVSVPSQFREYVDIGIDIVIDSSKSPYLKAHSGLIDTLDRISAFHNLQGMLHTLSGWKGKDGEFDWSLMKRSLGLANMSADVIKEEFKIPASWWGEKNKGMVLKDDGNWVLSSMDPTDHDLPVY